MLRFEVLGPVRAWRDDVELDLGAPQRRALLAALLLHDGRPVPGDELVDAIWGEEPPRAAAQVIRSQISRLRHVLDPGGGRASAVIEPAGGGYALRTGGAEVDRAVFEERLAAARAARRAGDVATEAAALRAVLALWRGTPMAEVRGDHAEAERTRLAELRLSAAEDLFAADIALGRHVEAAAGLAAMAAEQPYRERVRELLMLALSRSGRQADALGVFDETRRLLSEELGLDPGPGLREMQRRILAGDTGDAGPPPGTVHGCRPAQLPPDLTDFVGREDLLSGVVTSLAGPGVPVVGLVGLAGVGKTAAAVRAGHTVADRFPDGQFFVELGDGPEPSEVLGELLASFGVTGVPASARERVSLWRSMTAGRRVLVVLDDVRSAEQVRTLLPGAGAVVLTARRRLYEVAGVEWHTVEGLPDGDAFALLERIAGAERVRGEPEVMRRLIRKSSGQPLPIRVFGARLLARPQWTLAVAEQRIGFPELRMPECTAIEQPYESVYGMLTAAQARALRLVALAGEPSVPLEAAAALLDLPQATAEDLLEDLADLHLVEVVRPGTYRLPIPVRNFGMRRALVEDAPQDRDAALARLAATA
ncbi:BTAD domain-containing putative transcriptional regulator [Sphaerisporangium sp. B11E5]|uniref:AfsR/SARP family transcriptional regulator n=1 Tax=Sphaerisporangium sp. B11E5 TaxID=3153563 RepID=UPI00325C970E